MSNIDAEMYGDPFFAQAMKEKALASKSLDQLWAEYSETAAKGTVAPEAEEKEDEEETDVITRRVPENDTKYMESMKKRAAEEARKNAEEEEETDTRQVKTSDFYQPRKWWPQQSDAAAEPQSVPTTVKAPTQSISMDEKCKQVIGKMRSLTSKYEAELAALQSELGVHNGGRRSRKLVRRQKKRVSKK